MKSGLFICKRHSGSQLQQTQNICQLNSVKSQKQSQILKQTVKINEIRCIIFNLNVLETWSWGKSSCGNNAGTWPSASAGICCLHVSVTCYLLFMVLNLWPDAALHTPIPASLSLIILSIFVSVAINDEMLHWAATVSRKVPGWGPQETRGFSGTGVSVRVKLRADIGQMGRDVE